METNAKKLFEAASAKLNEANKELFKSKDKIGTYLVCKNAQFAIEHFLKGFLLQHGIVSENNKTIESLYEECIAINPEFKKVDLSEFECKSYNHNSAHCNEVSKVSNCFDIADSLDTFLKQQKII